MIESRGSTIFYGVYSFKKSLYTPSRHRREHTAHPDIAPGHGHRTFGQYLLRPRALIVHGLMAVFALAPAGCALGPHLHEAVVARNRRGIRVR